MNAVYSKSPHVRDTLIYSVIYAFFTAVLNEDQPTRSPNHCFVFPLDKYILLHFSNTRFQHKHVRPTYLNEPPDLIAVRKKNERAITYHQALNIALSWPIQESRRGHSYLKIYPQTAQEWHAAFKNNTTKYLLSRFFFFRTKAMYFTKTT